jgi:lipopolysaccharide export system protein LptA
VFVKFDKDAKKLTVREDGSEKEYTITDSTTFMRGDKSVPAEKAMAALEKMKEGKGKLSIETDGKKLKEVKMPEPKKKTN